MTDLKDLIDRASKEGWHIRPATLVAVPILDGDGIAVGFYCPHPAGRGRTRVGPIYVIPERRGQGLALQAYSWAASNHRLVAYVHDTNTPSLKLHEKAGFQKWYRSAGGWYMRRPSGM